MDADTVGTMVRWARKRAGMTQLELARATGMPQPSIARIEAGTVVPRTATLIALLHATGHQLSVVPIDPATDREDGL
jgi:predicted transcriptional regulator